MRKANPLPQQQHSKEEHEQGLNGHHQCSEPTRQLVRGEEREGEEQPNV